jgi:hypothetical protein
MLVLDLNSKCSTTLLRDCEDNAQRQNHKNAIYNQPNEGDRHCSYCPRRPALFNNDISDK